jgi:PAS domain S-box-containing protein
MKDTKRTKLILQLSLVVSFMILIVISVVFMEQFKSIPSNHEKIIQSYNIQDNLQQLYINLLEAENSQRAFLLTQNNTFIPAYNTKKSAITTILDSNYYLVEPENPKRSHFTRLDSLINLRIEHLDRVLLNSSRIEDFEILHDGLTGNTQSMEEIKALIDSLKHIENYESGLAAFANQKKGKCHLLYLLAEMLFSLGAFLLAYIILVKNLKQHEFANRKLKISNTIFEQVEKISDSAHWHFSMDEKILHFSTHMYTLLGYEPDSFIPDLKFVFRTVLKSDRKVLIETLRKIRDSDDPNTIEFDFFQKDGSIRTFRMAVCMMKDGQDQEIAIGANLDVTNEKEQDLRLQKLFSDLQIQNNIFKNAEILAGTGSYSYHHESRKTEFSDNLFRILGYPPNSFIPSADKIVQATNLAENGKKCSDQDLLNLVEKHGEFPIKIVTQNGKSLILASKMKLHSESGEIISIITFKDVTADITIRNSLEDKNTELTQIISELDSFNHIASHDLQEPLRKIQTFASRILSGNISEREPKEADYLVRIQNSAKRMQKLINDLLSLTLITKGEKVSSIVSLNQLLEESIRDLTPDLLEKKSIVSYSILPEADVIPFQIRQLFDNLITNALKYSKSNEPLQLEIKAQKLSTEDAQRFRLSKPKDYIKISFVDNGIGFDQMYADTIFAPFKRLHTRSEYTGTGVGLSICKKVMENHKGYIYATSEVDKGTTFHLIFPRKTAKTPPNE